MANETQLLQSIHIMVTQICEALGVDTSKDLIHLQAEATERAKSYYADMKAGRNRGNGASATPPVDALILEAEPDLSAEVTPKVVRARDGKGRLLPAATKAQEGTP